MALKRSKLTFKSTARLFHMLLGANCNQPSQHFSIIMIYGVKSLGMIMIMLVYMNLDTDSVTDSSAPQAATAETNSF